MKLLKIVLILAALGAVALIPIACGNPPSSPGGGGNPTFTYTFTPTQTPSQTPCGFPGDTCTFTFTFTATDTPTVTPTSTPTNTNTFTFTITLTATNTPSKTSTPTFAVPPRPFKTQFSTGNLYPSCLALSSGTTVFVSGPIGATTSIAIQVYTSAGVSITSWASYGSTGFDFPAFLAVGPTNGMVYEMNPSNAYPSILGIYEFNQSGVTIGFWTGYGTATYAYSEGLATAPNGNIYAADDSGIGVYDSSGVTLFRFAGGGNMFSQGGGIAVSPLSPYNVYILEDGAGHLVVREYSASGSPITFWGTAGTGYGSFTTPFGIAIDPNNGNVLLADQVNHLVQEFDSNGNFLSQWGLGGSFYPYSLAVASNGDVYVADYGSKMVRVFGP